MWDELEEGEHSDFLVLDIEAEVQCCPHRQDVHKNNNILIPKRDAIINFGWIVLPHSPCVPDHLPSDYHLLGALKRNSMDTILPVSSHHRMLCAGGCRRRTATFCGWEYMLLFKGGTRMSTKMEARKITVPVAML
jgi:hypothetical protein